MLNINRQEAGYNTLPGHGDLIDNKTVNKEEYWRSNEGFYDVELASISGSLGSEKGTSTDDLNHVK